MEKTKSKKGVWIALWILIFLLVTSWLTNFGLIALIFSESPSIQDGFPIDSEPQLEEVWSSGYGEVKAVRIELIGLIMPGTSDTLFGKTDDMVKNILRQIKCASNDKNVKAIILEIDSPGGTVSASDEIFNALNHFKSLDESRKVIAHIKGVGASGAYYVAMSADYIIAEPTSLVGSVGVILQTLNIKELADNIGLSSITIASGDYKDSLNPLKDPDPIHISHLTSLVNSMHKRFIDIVLENRKHIEPDTTLLFESGVLTGDLAYDSGWVDNVGYIEDALSKAADMLDQDDLYFIRYEEEYNYLSELFGAKLPSINIIKDTSSPKFLYLWSP